MLHMSNLVPKEDLLAWCRIEYDKLEKHANLKIPLRIVRDSGEMGGVMSDELISIIEENNRAGKQTRAILPCGPKSYYKPFTEKVNARSLSLADLIVYHMDECLTWEGKLLPKNHPYNFRTEMEELFYSPVNESLRVPEKNRNWMAPDSYRRISDEILGGDPVDITLGGWGQDGHIAYNQTRRHPFSSITLDELRNSRSRIQDNNYDTIVALAQRTFGSAYQFAPPMSVTLGVKECMHSKKIRVFSDTGAWKQTALRVALFSDPVTEYPITLLQEHPDAIITATEATARHPVSENPKWELF